MFQYSVCGRSKSVGRGRFSATDLKVDFDRPTKKRLFSTFSVKKRPKNDQIFREIATKLHFYPNQNLKNSLTLNFKLILYSIYLILPKYLSNRHTIVWKGATTQFFLTTGYENAFHSAVLNEQNLCQITVQ